LFGENSLQVLLNLDEYENFLKEEVSALKSQNASLQKELFELNELDPDSK
jgi:chaperonin cofactor prefoldin